MGSARKIPDGTRKRSAAAERPSAGAENPAAAAEKPPAGAESPAETAEPTGDGVESGARRDFADELRAWRMLRGQTQVALGDEINYSGSYISDIERCARMPSLDFARACDRALGLPGTLVRGFKRITLESFPGWFAPVLPFETQAVKIQSWDMGSLPGLLQTADYARALFRAGRPDDPDDIIERDVVARMQRQEIFSREHPPSAWFIIDELALRRIYGSKTVMAKQLDKLIEKSAQPGIVIQIMPIAVTDCSGADGPMTVYNIPDSPQIGFTDGCEVGRIIDEPGVIAKLVTKFDHLRATALSPRESSRLLAKIRSEYSE
jgi:transcriptional regulator with XRE-family HTH domain